MSTSLRDQLQAIRDERGSLTPALVVEVAADPNHPLHNRFEWDDSRAAHQWRLEQAGQLLRVTFRPDLSKPTDLRAFVAVKGEDSPTSDYVPVGEAMTDPFTQKLVLAQFKREWKAFQRRYEHLAEFATTILRDVHERAS